MQTAIIDMGTNTFHLLVASWNATDYRILHRERVPVRVGVGGINQNVITAEGIDRAVGALILFKEKIDELGVANVFAFGTSALRNANNSKEVISRIRAATGIDTRVISGDEEAQFIYEGVNLALKFGQEKSLVVDIGGGSVEFIIGNAEKVFWKQSFEIGAQRLLEQFHKHDPILSSEIDLVVNHYRKILHPLFDAMQTYQPRILAGSSGTFDTLSEIFCHQSGIIPADAPETPLTIDAFYKIYREIISKNRFERMKIPGMIDMRVDMIVVASCLVKFLLDHFEFNQIRVSSFSLKEGVLAALMKGKLAS
jgi:exopolyphosphatase/guanosine-5'-triphosphate,3'-diphosphate pyrophosphatase